MNKSKILTPFIHPFRVHTPNLLTETFINAVRPKDLAALHIPLNMFTAYLKTLTARCAELNDKWKMFIIKEISTKNDYSDDHNFS